MILMTRNLQLAALALVAALSTTLRAQEDDAATRRQQLANADPTVTIDFAGGNLTQFVEQLRNASHGANIVVAAQGADVEVPALSLRDATVETALRAVGNVVPDNFKVAVETERAAGGQPVHAVLVRQIGRPGTVSTTGPTETSIVQVFSIRMITEGLPNDPPGITMAAQTLLTAIDTGLSVDANGLPATIRYHKESGLLFVRGTPMQLNFIQDTLKNISRDLDQRRSASRRRSGGAQREEPPEEPPASKPGKSGDR